MMRYTYEDWCYVMRLDNGSCYPKGYLRCVYYAMGSIGKIVLTTIFAIYHIVILLFVLHCLDVKSFSALIWVVPMIFGAYCPRGFGCLDMIFILSSLLMGMILVTFYGFSHTIGSEIVAVGATVLGLIRLITWRIIEGKIWKSISTFERLAERDLIGFCIAGLNIDGEFFGDKYKRESSGAFSESK